MLRRLLPYLVATFAVAVSVAGPVARPADGAVGGTVDYVVLAGVPGLVWEDVNPRDTPTLWAMADRGAIGSLAVRSARRPTCPVDGWLTLGAGNYAAEDGDPVRRSCPATVTVNLERPDRLGAHLPRQRDVVRYNQQKQPWGTIAGTLAESVRCTTAIGPGAAVAAARPYGRVDRYLPALPADPRDTLDDCLLNIVDLGSVAGNAPADRAVGARRADAALARVLAGRPERSLVLVAGLADTARSSRLHVVMADGPQWTRGWLTSPSTDRPGYVQLVDLAPTALSALGRPMPLKLFAGKPVTVSPERPAQLQRAVTTAAHADLQARTQQPVSRIFFAVLAGAQLVLFAAAVPLMRRARRHAGPAGPAAPSRRMVALVEVALVAAALFTPAALMTNVVPWWRAERPAPLFAAITVALVALGTLLIRRSRRYQQTLWPMAMVAGVATSVVVADVLSGTRLQLNGVAGYSAVDGVRYAGLGPVGQGLFIAGMLIVAACLGQRVRRGWRPAVVVLLGGIGVLLVGSPYLGADAVAAIAVTAGVCVSAAISAGGWLTMARVAWATLAGLAVTIGFAALDLQRPVSERGSLGRLLTAMADGTGGPAVNRAAASNLRALVDSPLTLLAVLGAVVLLFAMFSGWGGLKRVFGLHPAVRAAVAGTTVAVLLAGGLGGSALQVAGAAAATMVPVLVLTALRVLDHAADRTRPPVVPVAEPVPAGDRPAPVSTDRVTVTGADGRVGAGPARDDAGPVP